MVVVDLIIMAVIITIILTIFIMKRRKFTIPRTIESNEFEMMQEYNNDPIEKTSNTGFSGGGVMHEELDAESTHKAPVGNGKVFIDAIPDADYAVVDKKPSPNVPNKSPALQQHLETSPITSSTTTATATTSTAAVAVAATAETTTTETAATAATAATVVTGQEGQSKIVTLSRSIVSKSALNDNPEYAPIGESNPVYSTANSPVYAIPDHEADAGMENMYAELGLPTAVQEPNPSDNIYESICNEEFLSPSSFNEGPFPRTDNPEDLYHYSPIYSVPVVAETEVVQPLEVTSHNIEEVRNLGTGNFGAVLLAKTVGLSHKELRIGNSTDTSVSVLVAVKKLKANANVGARNLFDKECKFMSRLNDPNVVRLLCVCKSGPVPFLIMEYMEHGDLNQYLQKYDKVAHDEGGSPAGEGIEITQQKLIAICTQIASGMKYLATNNFVHRDLATRNCLVNEDYDVKIADFGMSRNLYDSHYYVIKGQAVLPIRWMASECFYGQFSAKTDVWAFGATMWEVFELAKHEPYYEMLDREVVMDACKKENRTILPRPAECPEEVYQIMLRCWPYLASERATFEELEKSLLFLSNDLPFFYTYK